MLKRILLIATLLISALCQAGENALPAAVLKRIKDATVFVKLADSSGSGFLVFKDASAGYVVTNSHVVGREYNSPRLIDVVFNSGTQQERVVFATVVAQSESRDLALLKVEAQNLPSPVELAGLSKPPPPASTLPFDARAPRPLDPATKPVVYFVGFPFGERLSAKPAAPEITIGEGVLASIKREGNQEWIEFEGDVNPGNSGGPVVDVKGVVQGVTTLKIMGQKLGRCIPASDACVILQWFLKSSVVCPWLSRPVAGLKNPNLNNNPKPAPAPDPKKKVADTVVIWPMESGVDLGCVTLPLGSGRVTPLRVNGAQVRYDMCWSRDGKFVYLAERNPGRIRKISVPSLMEEKALRLPGQCTSLGLSSEGLVAAVGNTGLYILDEDTLDLKKAFRVPAIYRFTTTPSIPYVFFAINGGLFCVNLMSGRLDSEIRDALLLGAPEKYHALTRPFSSFSVPYLSPDGQKLFVRGAGCLYRYSVVSFPRCEEAGPQIGAEFTSEEDLMHGAIEFSAESNYVAWVANNLPVSDGKGQPLLAQDPLKSNSTLYIFKTSNLQTPAVKLGLAGVPRALGFDRKAGRIYVLNDNCEFITATPAGVIESSHNLYNAVKTSDFTDIGANLRSSTSNENGRILVHPDGKKGLILSNGVILWFEF